MLGSDECLTSPAPLGVPPKAKHPGTQGGAPLQGFSQGMGQRRGAQVGLTGPVPGSGVHVAAPHLDWRSSTPGPTGPAPRHQQTLLSHDPQSQAWAWTVPVALQTLQALHGATTGQRARTGLLCSPEAPKRHRPPPPPKQPGLVQGVHCREPCP